MRAVGSWRLKKQEIIIQIEAMSPPPAALLAVWRFAFCSEG